MVQEVGFPISDLQNQQTTLQHQHQHKNANCCWFEQ